MKNNLLRVATHWITSDGANICYKYFFYKFMKLYFTKCWRPSWFHSVPKLLCWQLPLPLQSYLTHQLPFSTYQGNFMDGRRSFFVSYLIVFKKLNKKKIRAGQKIIAKLLDFHSQISLNDLVFWKFSTPPRHVRGCGKLQNPQIFAPFGLWKPSNPKIPQT